MKFNQQTKELTLTQREHELLTPIINQLILMNPKIKARVLRAVLNNLDAATGDEFVPNEETEDGDEAIVVLYQLSSLNAEDFEASPGEIGQLAAFDDNNKGR